ncbi:hypothetical protein EIP86_009143 [Pleurotus ostreatoroseus]|nr:hypothetical protein EIP86_009143 [Pleurotus ostreatoroseus]
MGAGQFAYSIARFVQAFLRVSRIFRISNVTGNKSVTLKGNPLENNVIQEHRVCLLGLLHIGDNSWQIIIGDYEESLENDAVSTVIGNDFGEVNAAIEGSTSHVIDDSDTYMTQQDLSFQDSPPTLPFKFYDNPSGSTPVHDTLHDSEVVIVQDLSPTDVIDVVGIVVPQSVYPVLQQYDQQPTVRFSVNNMLGIRLDDALANDFNGLANASAIPILTEANRISCYIQWPGYEPWNNDLHVVDNNSQPYTLARVAYTIAKAVQQFFSCS